MGFRDDNVSFYNAKEWNFLVFSQLLTEMGRVSQLNIENLKESQAIFNQNEKTMDKRM